MKLLPYEHLEMEEKWDTSIGRNNILVRNFHIKMTINNLGSWVNLPAVASGFIIAHSLSASSVPVLDLHILVSSASG